MVGFTYLFQPDRYAGMRRSMHYFSFDRFLTLDCSGTDRATAAFSAGSGINRCLPDMSLPALPPDFFIAAEGYILRPKIAIQLFVPFACNLRYQCCQVIKAF